MGAERTVHVRVVGRVQGVGYRAWAEATALSLGLKGWVRNRRDGSVEMVVQGKRDAVGDMLEQCADGPPYAQVARVEILGEGAGAFQGFEVRATV